MRVDGKHRRYASLRDGRLVLLRALFRMEHNSHAVVQPAEVRSRDQITGHPVIEISSQAIVVSSSEIMREEMVISDQDSSLLVWNTGIHEF